MRAFCTGCGDEVIIGTGCCKNCKVGASKRRSPNMTPILTERIKAMYWEDNRTPNQITKITDVPISTVKEIVYAKENRKPMTTT